MLRRPALWATLALCLVLGGCTPAARSAPPERGAERSSRAPAAQLAQLTSGQGAPVAQFLVEPDDGRAALEHAIGGAQRTIDLVVYLLSDRQIVAALKAAQSRGVRVRVMLEEHPYGEGPGNGAVAQ